MAKIQHLKETHEGEWLAIEILKDGPSGPEEGTLIHHSNDKSEVWNAVKDDKRRIYVTYAGSLLEEGYAAAF